MEFCDNCGGLMMPKKTKSGITLTCRKCGKRKKAKEKKFTISSVSNEKKNKIIVVSKKSKIDILPKTKIRCPKCKNNEAMWWMQQMRSADEAATRFYKCTKCGNTWREYE